MKAQFVFENIKFTRGGKDELDRQFKGPPIGTLFKWGGRFPYIVILVGRSEDRSQGIIQQVGIFQGGGKKKTRFRFYSPKNKERYKIPYDALKPIPENLWDRIKNDADWDPFSSGKTYWERFEDETGVKPILPIYESIRFERGGTDREKKRKMVGDYYIPGEIVVRDKYASGRNKELYIWCQKEPGNIAEIEVYHFGNIERGGMYNNYGPERASFIHDTQNKTGKGWIIEGTYRHANEEEREMIQKALDSGKYDRYIKEAKKKTGLTPFV